MQADVKLGPVGPGLQRSQSMKSPVGRKGSAARNRTSRYIGVGSSNRKNQWQARILVHGKVSQSARPEPSLMKTEVFDADIKALNRTSGIFCLGLLVLCAVCFLLEHPYLDLMVNPFGL